MDILTGEEVVSDICKRISTNLPKKDIVAVYKNKPKQGMKKPCAFVHQINADHANRMAGKAVQTFLIDVRIHAEDSRCDLESWHRRIANILVDILGAVEVSKQRVKNSSMSWNTQEDVLHFLVSYSFTVTKLPQKEQVMSDMYYGQRIKN